MVNMVPMPETITQLLVTRLHNQADKPAYTFIDNDFEETMTYQQLFARSYSVATEIRKYGSSGQRVILAFPSGLDYICSFFGCLMAGVVAVPVYPPKTSKKDIRFEAILKDSEASIILTSPSVLESLQIRNSDFLKQGVTWLTPNDKVEMVDDSPNLFPCTPDTLAFLQYTSGSTSTPKGVMVTHENIIANTRMMKETYKFPADGVTVSWLPLFHDLGIIGMIINALYNGYHCVFLSPLSFLQSPITWLKAITKYKGNITAAPNFAFDLCVRKIKPEQIDTLDLTSFTHALCGSEPIKMSSVQNFISKFAPAGFRSEAFIPSYGLAEATLMVSGAGYGTAPKSVLLHKNQLLQNKIETAFIAPFAEWNKSEFTEVVSCGPISRELIVRIVDPVNGRACSPDRIGEIWVSGPSIARGYWNQSEATTTTFQAQIVDEEGVQFLKTGDLGFIMSGELYITSRLKDTILIRGENHYPNDIEWSVVNCNPYLNKEACGAFSILDDNHDEQLIVVAEIERQFRKADLQPVVKAVRACIAEEHSLQLYGLILCSPGGVPKTTSGKIQRNHCKSLFIDEKLPALLAVIKNQTVDDWGNNVVSLSKGGA